MRDFEADRKLCDAATAGNFVVTKYQSNALNVEIIVGDEPNKAKWANPTEHDAKFIYSARDGWPDALKRIAELEDELLQKTQQVDELLQKVQLLESRMIDEAFDDWLTNAERVNALREANSALKSQHDGYREIAEEAAELGKSQAAEFDAEVEKLEAHNAVLRGALEAVQIESRPYICNEVAARVSTIASMALNMVPTDSAAKVRKLVDALELMVDTIDDQLGGGGWVPEFEADIDEKLEPWASIFDAQDKAQKALAEWRGE